MRDSFFWRGVAVLAAAILINVVFTSIKNEEHEIFAAEIDAAANVQELGKSVQHFVTSSQDGRKVFLWRFDGKNPPKFVGESDAILGQ